MFITVVADKNDYDDDDDDDDDDGDDAYKSNQIA